LDPRRDSCGKDSSLHPRATRVLCSRTPEGCDDFRITRFARKEILAILRAFRASPEDDFRNCNAEIIWDYECVDYSRLNSRQK